MPDIYFKCECGKSLAVDEAGVGRTVACVDCGKPVVVPEPDLEFDCEGCGAALLAPLSISGDQLKCAACGQRMTAPSVTDSAAVHAAVGRDCIPASIPTYPITRNAGIFNAGLQGGIQSRTTQDIPVGRDCIPACIPASPSSPARVMDSLMRRQTEFTIRRRPPRRSLRDRINPALPTWLLRAAAVFAVLVLARELLRGIVTENAQELVGESSVFVADSGVEDGKRASFPAVLAASERCVVEALRESETAEAIKSLSPRSNSQTPKTAQSVKSVKLDQVHPEPIAIALPPVILDVEEITPTKLTANASETAESSGSDTDEARQLKDKVLALESLIGNDPQQFHKDLSLLWAEILEYTTAHSGVALDENHWRPAFRTTTDWMLGDNSLTYERSFALVNRALDVLRNVQSANKAAPVQLAMMMAVIHASRWMSGHVLENARMIDGIWEWARSLDDPVLRSACFCQTYSFEGNLLISRFELPEDVREEFIRERERKLWEFLDDEALSLNDRTDALSHWSLAMHHAGRSDDAARALAVWQHTHGENIAPARYYHVLMQVALFGLGDWELADRALREAGYHAHQWRTSFDHWSFEEMCRLYYRNIHCNGYETVRTGSKLRKESEEKTIKMASGR